MGILQKKKIVKRRPERLPLIRWKRELNIWFYYIFYKNIVYSFLIKINNVYKNSTVEFKIHWKENYDHPTSLTLRESSPKRRRGEVLHLLRIVCAGTGGHRR